MSVQVKPKRYANLQNMAIISRAQELWKNVLLGVKIVIIMEHAQYVSQDSCSKQMLLKAVNSVKKDVQVVPWRVVQAALLNTTFTPVENACPASEKIANFVIKLGFVLDAFLDIR